MTQRLLARSRGLGLLLLLLAPIIETSRLDAQHPTPRPRIREQFNRAASGNPASERGRGSNGAVGRASASGKPSETVERRGAGATSGSKAERWAKGRTSASFNASASGEARTTERSVSAPRKVKSKADKWSNGRNTPSFNAAARGERFRAAERRSSGTGSKGRSGAAAPPAAPTPPRPLPRP